MSKSFLDYSMSVIISRALPDARDGLKPSQRRILYAMHDLVALPEPRSTSSARRSAATPSGNYHPHGEAVIYPTLVHMAQPWAMRETLVDGQGNFGSVEGDPPAAMRYTEARLTHLGAAPHGGHGARTRSISSRTTTRRRTEPTVFPAAFPNLLVNGGTGIAVGMATNIPPHNLGEVIDGICAQIDNPDITIDELMEFIKGPDFPTGCIICGIGGHPVNISRPGAAACKVRGKAGVEELKGGREQIVITEIPYNVNRADAGRAHRRAGEREGPHRHHRRPRRVRREHARRHRTQARRASRRSSSTISTSTPRWSPPSRSTCSPSTTAGRSCSRSRTPSPATSSTAARSSCAARASCCAQAEERAETLEGYLIALANMDDFIRIIRDSANRDEATRQAARALDWTRGARSSRSASSSAPRPASSTASYALQREAGRTHILDLRLYQLTGLEREKIIKRIRRR